jgi:ribonuclease Z
MSLTNQVLGEAGCDNALYLRIDSGKSLERLLFDCGENCASTLPFTEVSTVDQLFFSHLHMDHVAGFDSFFRCTYDRLTKPNHIWGPPGTAQIMQHRFQGFLWNLQTGELGAWRVSEIHEAEIRTTRFELGEAFSMAHQESTQPHEGIVWRGAGATVRAFTMDHKTPSLAYLVEEHPRRNVDTSKLANLGLKPGPWVRQLKDASPDAPPLLIDGVSHEIRSLQEALITESKGGSTAYLTDFLLDDAAMDFLAGALHGCHTIICEGQYRHADIELARRNYHMTTVRAAELAKRAVAGKLILFHVSDRYEPTDWLEMLREAREVFPNTHYPEQWGLDLTQ